MARIAILGVFVVDLAFRGPRLPVMGETLLGQSFMMGPGGKGSNQAVAAARAGGDVAFITRIGQDTFGDMGMAFWQGDRIETSGVVRVEASTGAAFIFVSGETGNNAIIIEPGAAGGIDPAMVQGAKALFAGADVVMVQLEQPLAAARAALEIARAAGRTTLLNPAPAAPLDDSLLALCDYITPNETEAAALTGLPVTDIDSARRAADVLLKRGVDCAVITMGAQGALVHNGSLSELVPAFRMKAIDTTGAGDAFNGGFAVALCEGKPLLDAARFGSAVAGLSVTRKGAAAAMPTRAEIDALLAKG